MHERRVSIDSSSGRGPLAPWPGAGVAFPAPACAGPAVAGGGAGRISWRRGRLISALLDDLKPNAPVLPRPLRDRVALLARFQTCLFHRIRLHEAIEVLLLTPMPIKVVVAHDAGQRIDDRRV